MIGVSSGIVGSAGAVRRLKRPPPVGVAVIRGPQASMRASMPRALARRLSVVVVTYNSNEAVAASLPPLCAQLRPEDELVVVDNASADGTVAAVRRLAPAARVRVFTVNTGFAAAANAGARAAAGDLLLFLNPDAAPLPGFAD